MCNRDCLFISIHHRDELSLQVETRNTFSAYHWGVLLAPKISSGWNNTAYDVSNGIRIDSETQQDLNEARDWFFSTKDNVNPLASGRLIGRVKICTIPPEMTGNGVKRILEDVALPEKESGEKCRHWVWRAIFNLQKASVIPKIDIEKLKPWILDYANQCLENPSPDNICEYEETDQ
ncbi:hypothetical protein LOZ58_001161 [Ophidiomyces ophidiicola]|nr:hypothetical protein LOZ65_001084 [Ophidiomyces ophidiicola]KAI1937218.1 hypothetical protein LOZ66_004136 [Ophidiomyces ophidiicola]KAI1965315.1 hypothetical protein LOZ58_001161 [Ophidiomyces ophidiicola]